MEKNYVIPSENFVRLKKQKQIFLIIFGITGIITLSDD